jgi:hypothetical protein
MATPTTTVGTTAATFASSAADSDLIFLIDSK